MSAHQPNDSNDDLGLHNYQDDIDTNDDKTDPLMNELNDDIVETLGVPAEEFKNELDKYDGDKQADDDTSDDNDDEDDRNDEMEDLDDNEGSHEDE